MSRIKKENQGAAAVLLCVLFVAVAVIAVSRTERGTESAAGAEDSAAPFEGKTYAVQISSGSDTGADLWNAEGRDGQEAVVEEGESVLIDNTADEQLTESESVSIEQRTETSLTYANPDGLDNTAVPGDGSYAEPEDEDTAAEELTTGTDLPDTRPTTDPDDLF